jgi:hypothetical protein
LVTDLDLILLELAASGSGKVYLQVRLEEERRRDAAALSRPKPNRTLSMSDLFGREELKMLAPSGPHPATAVAQPSWSNDEQQRVVEVLSRLYQARRAGDRERGAREQLRKERLQWVATLLTALLLLACLTFAVALADAAGESSKQAWIAAPLALLVGALGAGLAGARVLHEELIDPDSLARFKAAFLAQLPIGGTLGLVALALLRAGVLPAFQGEGEDRSVVALVIYAFLAGYSEPFVLGILRGLAGRGDADPGGQPTTDARSARDR